MITDTQEAYGIVSRILHWGMALAVFAMFGLGWWMVGLDYYSPYYNSAPDLHRSAGMVLLAVLILRTAWRLANVKPDDADLTQIERRVSRVVHKTFYALLMILLVSGYLISTADGRALGIFGWFSVPSLVAWNGQEDAAGLVHEWSAYAVMALAVIHSAAALKHRFADKGRTRNRMWSGSA